MFRVLICQEVYYFMCLYMCVYYVKRVDMSRSLLFHVFIYIYVCTIRAFPRKLELSGATCGFVVNYFCGTLT